MARYTGQPWWEDTGQPPTMDTPEVGPDNPWSPEAPPPDPSTEPLPPPTSACPPDKPHMYEGYCQKCPPGQWNHNNVCEPIGSPSDDRESSSSNPVSAVPAVPKATKSPYADAMSKLLFEQLQGMLSGKDQPFSPEVIAKLNAQALGSNKAQLEVSQQDLQKRLINAGLSRSGVAPAEQGKMRSRADASLSNDFRSVAITAVQSNYAAKAQALSQAQAFLNSERAGALSTDQLTFGYAQLNQQWKALQAQFEQQKWVINNSNEQQLIQWLIEQQNKGTF